MSGNASELDELRQRLSEAERALQTERSGELSRRVAEVAQARLAALVQFSGNPIVGLNRERQVEDWNSAAESLYGYSAAEVLGIPLGFLEPAIRRGECERLLARVSQEQVAVDFETVHQCKDGSTIDVAMTVSPVRDSLGRLIGFSAITRNISERKRAEHSFWQLLESAPDAMIAVDRAGKICVVNALAERTFGYERNELMGLSVEMLVPEALRVKHAEAVAKYARAPRRRLMTEGRTLRARRKDGTEFDAEITLSPLNHHPGELTVIAAVRDVTERNQMRDQLIVSDRMVSIGMLAAGMAHEINNPLSAVTANLDLALGQVAELSQQIEGLGELRDGLQDARDAADRVRLIVRDLKIFSRADEERLHPVDVRRVMESTLRMAWNEIRHRANLVKNYREVPAVRASDSRLGQVFLNILVNAAQAMPEGRAQANEIRISSEMDSSDRVLVTISDTGCGMPRDVLSRLFTPFFTTKSVGLGTGLGLSICHRLVTSFGGQITVESEIGRGSTFRIFLPPAPSEEVRNEPPADASPAKRRGRVLVIDDEKMVTQVVRRSLGQEHDVTALTSAQEALQRVLSGERFDVILCDLMMPQMTGMDLYAELLRHCPEQATQMIFLTGGAFTPLARSFLDQTPNLRVEKPFDLQHLRTLVIDRIR